MVLDYVPTCSFESHDSDCLCVVHSFQDNHSVVGDASQYVAQSVWDQLNPIGKLHKVSLNITKLKDARGMDAPFGSN